MIGASCSYLQSVASSVLYCPVFRFFHLIRDFHFFEENHTELFRRIDVEFFTSYITDDLLQELEMSFCNSLL
jgi:hypothetical protein